MQNAISAKTGKGYLTNGEQFGIIIIEGEYV
jgi:hypothetical protein